MRDKTSEVDEFDQDLDELSLELEDDE